LNNNDNLGIQCEPPICATVQKMTFADRVKATHPLLLIRELPPERAWMGQPTKCFSCEKELVQRYRDPRAGALLGPRGLNAQGA
jgi:hypothetical protein